MVYAEMLQLGRVNAPGERSHAVSVIVREARHLTHLIDNVLLFSRASREKPTAPPAHPLPLAPLVHELVRTFAPLARQHRISIREQLDERLAASISAPVLRHALLNLLDNAAKYAPPSSVITVSTVRHWELVRIYVDDQGAGVPACGAAAHLGAVRTAAARRELVIDGQRHRACRWCVISWSDITGVRGWRMRRTAGRGSSSRFQE